MPFFIISANLAFPSVVILRYSWVSQAKDCGLVKRASTASTLWSETVPISLSKGALVKTFVTRYW